MEANSYPEIKISVVIPTYNRIKTLARALNSVLAQTRPADEIIVVDDGSEDGTDKLISSEFEGSVHYIYQQNRGVSCARNVGIKKASGDWIALLDSDDEWKTNKLEKQYEAIANHPEYNFCHTNEVWIRNGVRVNAMAKHEKSGGYIFEKCLPLCVISPSSALIKKKVFNDIGFFDEELPACEDYDFWLRYCCDNPVLYIEEPLLVKHGGHKDQLSKKFLGMDIFRLRALLNLVSSKTLTDDQLDAVKSIFLEKHNILSNGARKHENHEMVQVCEKLLLELRQHIS